MAATKQPDGSDKARKVERDAEGQFVKSNHGRRNNGVSSASPRVVTGTDDATFKKDPGRGDGPKRSDR